MLEKSWAAQEVEYNSESDHDSEFTFVSIERTLLTGKSEIRQDVEVACFHLLACHEITW